MAERRVELTFDRGTLLLTAPGLEAADVPSGFVADGRAGGRYRATGMAYRRALGQLRRLGYTVDDSARGYGEVALTAVAHREPFPYQHAALSAWLAAERRGCVILPTGAGKTFVAELAMAAVQRATLIVAPTLDLVAQWARRLALAFRIEVGIVGGGSNEVSDVTVTTYDSAHLHMDRLGARFGLVIFDEVHHLPSDAYRMAAELAIAPFRLGLTATPERADGLHARLDELVGPICFRLGVSDLRGQFLADYAVVRIEVDLTPEERVEYDTAEALFRGFLAAQGIRLGAPNGWQSFLQASNRSDTGRAAFQAYQAHRRIALANRAKLDVMEELFAEHAEDKIVYFAHDRGTVYDVSRRFLVPVITHETPVVERKHWLEAIGDGRVRILGTSRVLNEGVDMPDVSVGIIHSGTGSPREHVQRLGRILRRGANKRAVLYELVTANTVDSRTSDRRRDHEAFDETDDAAEDDEEVSC